MKNLVYKVLLGASMTVILGACNDEDSGPDFVDLGANVLLQNGSITPLDRNEDIKLKIFSKTGVKVEGIEIHKDAKKVSDAKIVSEELATFNASTLAPYDQFGDKKDQKYGTFNVSLVSKLSNGKTINNKFPLKVISTISFTNTIESLEYKNPYTKLDKDKKEVTKNIVFKSNALTTLDEVTVAWKKNKNGTYAPTKENYFTKKDGNYTINLKTLNYLNEYNLNAGDTLYYRVTAKKGNLTDSSETKVAIVTQAMSAAKSFTFSEGNKSLGFLDADKVDVEYGSETITSTGGLKFFKVTKTGDDLEKYFTDGDLFNARVDFDDNTSTTSISNFELNDVYLYKTKRDDKVSYGLIKITEVLVVNGVQKNVKIDYKEGVIYE